MFVVFGIGISLGNVAGGTDLSMIGVLCSSPPANSLVTWCVSEEVLELLDTLSQTVQMM